MWTMRSLTTFRAATGRLAQPIAQSRALSTMNTLRAASVPRARLAAPATNALHTLLRSPSPACLAAPHLRASRALRTRFMSTTPPPQGSPATVTFFKQTASWVVQNKTVVMVVAGMSVGELAGHSPLCPVRRPRASAHDHFLTPATATLRLCGSHVRLLPWLGAPDEILLQCV